MGNKGPFCPGPAHPHAHPHTPADARADRRAEGGGRRGVGGARSSATAPLRRPRAAGTRLPVGPLGFQGWRPGVSLTLGRAGRSRRARSPEGTLGKPVSEQRPRDTARLAARPRPIPSALCAQGRGLGTTHVARCPQGAPAPGQGARSSSLGEAPLSLAPSAKGPLGAPPSVSLPDAEGPATATPAPALFAPKGLGGSSPAKRQASGWRQEAQRPQPTRVTLMHHPVVRHHSHRGRVWSARGQPGDQIH